MILIIILIILLIISTHIIYVLLAISIGTIDNDDLKDDLYELFGINFLKKIKKKLIKTTMKVRYIELGEFIIFSDGDYITVYDRIEYPLIDYVKHLIKNELKNKPRDEVSISSEGNIYYNFRFTKMAIYAHVKVPAIADNITFKKTGITFNIYVKSPHIVIEMIK